MDIETYLTSKKIDAAAFQQGEPDLWKAWSKEFEHMHANSFTIQKLNLINPIRRKYPLKVVLEKQPSPQPPTVNNPTIFATNDSAPNSNPPKPSIPRPVFKPKPKMS